MTDKYKSTLDLLTPAAYVLAAAAICFVLLCSTGCSSSGAAYVVATSDPAAGYDPGLGVRVDLTTHGTLRPVLKATMTNAAKSVADTGYTYSAYTGVAYGTTWYGEAGWLQYGYKSTFKDGTVWKSDKNSWYSAVGYRAPNWSLALRYVPPTDDAYESDDISLEGKVMFGKVILFAEPSIYSFKRNGQDKETHSSVRAGIGWHW